MMSNLAIRWSLSVVLAAVSAAPALAASQRVYVKSERVTASQMDADYKACIEQTLAFMNGPNSPSPPLQHPTTGEILAHAFDMRGPKAAAAYEVNCMAERGYVVLALTKEENAALWRARGMPTRDQWYDVFVAQDLSQRIAVARFASEVRSER